MLRLLGRDRDARRARGEVEGLEGRAGGFDLQPEDLAETGRFTCAEVARGSGHRDADDLPLRDAPDVERAVPRVGGDPLGVSPSGPHKGADEPLRRVSPCGASRADVAGLESAGGPSLVSRLDAAADPVNENARVRTSDTRPEEVE